MDYKTIWNATCPQKIRLFLWKVSHEGLPTFKTLHSRHIVDNDTCPICKLQPETVKHCLFQCEKEKRTWNLIVAHINRGNNTGNPYDRLIIPPHRVPSEIAIQRQGDYMSSRSGGNNQARRVASTSTTSVVPPTTFKEFLRFSQNVEMFSICCYALWSILLARNEQVYKKQIQTPQQTSQITIILSQEYTWAVCKKILPNMVGERQQRNGSTGENNARTIWVKWSPPPAEWVKINMDGASKNNMVGQPERAGAGWICRNTNGNVIMAMADPIGITTTLVAETLFACNKNGDITKMDKHHL
ncbi:uncharacterized protein LOC113290899 [Papaver somniferum]|uniref:uncharacterized protein LOC113290899 n=1 Tax=Papaver somniferum TaxID=3469 RepID=UPI000E6FF91F|nr:uncharacterized protein LOC113290899 [Papaver somniferum]